MKPLLPMALGLLLTGFCHAEVPGRADLPPPLLRSPLDGMSMTDVATFFRWDPVEGCDQFDIEIARDAAFADILRRKRTKNVRYHENSYFPRDLLPPGTFHWRVRAVRDDRAGPWSRAFAVNVNSDRSVAKQPIVEIGPDRPLFILRNRHWDPGQTGQHLREIIPAGLERAILADDMGHLRQESMLAKARAYEALGVSFTIWANRGRASLSLVEYLFQNYPHCVGVAEGESLDGWFWEKGPEGNLSEQDYVHRAWDLCAKYGRFYFFGDGEGAQYKWTRFAHEERDRLERLKPFVVPMFKSTKCAMALHSMGAIEGLMASSYVRHCGMWADAWSWTSKCSGLGTSDRTSDCPRTFLLRQWLLGIAYGSTVFHLEAAHQWDGEGKGSPDYTRFYLPFLRAVVERRLIPSREAFLKDMRAAVACDLETALARHNDTYEPAFGFLSLLYGLTAPPRQEFIPNTGRYGIICLLPPGARGPDATRVIPQAELTDPERAAALFNSSCPARFDGDAFLWECGGTFIVMNAQEAQGPDQRYGLTLTAGPVRRVSGNIGVRQYVLGKADRTTCWFQTNAEQTERAMRVDLACAREPNITVAPAEGLVSKQWDPGRKTLTVRLSHEKAGGAVSVEVLE
jgi:hypothetical protein